MLLPPHIQKGVLEGLSHVRGNSLARFLREGNSAAPYPTKFFEKNHSSDGWIKFFEENYATIFTLKGLGFKNRNLGGSFPGKAVPKTISFTGVTLLPHNYGP
jgi:hypothetical protein